MADQQQYEYEVMRELFEFDLHDAYKQQNTKTYEKLVYGDLFNWFENKGKENESL